MSNKQSIDAKGKNPVTQAGRFSEELQAISGNVTSSDRVKLTEAHGFTRATISRYLRGDVRDNDTAATILQFFKACVLEREKALNQ